MLLQIMPLPACSCSCLVSYGRLFVRSFLFLFFLFPSRLRILSSRFFIIFVLPPYLRSGVTKQALLPPALYGTRYATCFTYVYIIRTNVRFVSAAAGIWHLAFCCCWGTVGDGSTKGKDHVVEKNPGDENDPRRIAFGTTQQCECLTTAVGYLI